MNTGSAENLFRSLVDTAPFQPATNYWRAVELDAVVRHGLPDGSGLDLGCGDGKLTAIIDDASKGKRRWTGIDLDPLETALALRSGRYEKVHTGSAENILEADASFDFVFSNSVLEHIPAIDTVLAEAARVLRPGGRFIATVPGPQFHELLGGPWLGRNKDLYRTRLDARCAHLRYWSATEWRIHLDLAGLELSGVVEYLSGRQLRHWERLSAVTGGALHLLSGRSRRPIEWQRMLGLRREHPNLMGRVAARASRALLAQLPVDSTGETGPFACLLIDARRR